MTAHRRAYPNYATQRLESHLLLTLRETDTVFVMLKSRLHILHEAAGHWRVCDEHLSQRLWAAPNADGALVVLKASTQEDIGMLQLDESGNQDIYLGRRLA